MSFKPIPHVPYERMKKFLKKHYWFHLFFHYTFCRIRVFISTFDWVNLLPECPKCKKNITKLGLAKTEENEFEITYDEEQDELEETLTDDSVGLPYPPKIVKEEYYCPECGAVLFTDREAAQKFLATKIP